MNTNCNCYYNNYVDIYLIKPVFSCNYNSQRNHNYNTQNTSFYGITIHNHNNK